ncbi:MAG: hypothetical protein NTW96_13140 [Planctomycetia bacterium]|nr:hypothetical protein [Planctomycetia bacterium]
MIKLTGLGGEVFVLDADSIEQRHRTFISPKKVGFTKEAASTQYRLHKTAREVGSPSEGGLG